MTKQLRSRQINCGSQAFQPSSLDAVRNCRWSCSGLHVQRICSNRSASASLAERHQRLVATSFARFNDTAHNLLSHGEHSHRQHSHRPAVRREVAGIEETDCCSDQSTRRFNSAQCTSVPFANDSNPDACSVVPRSASFPVHSAAHQRSNSILINRANDLLFKRHEVASSQQRHRRTRICSRTSNSATILQRH